MLFAPLKRIQRLEASGIIKGGPNPANAKKFLDFVNSKKAHQMIVDIDKRRSARSDVAPPAGLPDAKTLKTFAYDTKAAATQVASASERIN